MSLIVQQCIMQLAMPSMMAARSVGQNSGPIFRHLSTKVYRIKNTCVEVSIVCNTVFRLTMSRCVPEIFAIKLQSCAISCQNLMFLGHQISRGGKGHHPNF